MNTSGNGSSPRAWGILTNVLKKKFIFLVHPHVRGEYLFSGKFESYLNGSSPRAWGIQQSRWRCASKGRFIPTCVGNTVSKLSKSFFFLVHPHVRGEYVNFSARPSNVDGSSPRAWGIPLILFHTAASRRFIPTCVGNTQLTTTTIRREMVHPHVRGEYFVISLGACCKNGSSPRAWGILLDAYRSFN